MSSTVLNAPSTRDLLVQPADAEELRAASSDWPSLDLTHHQLCDLELLVNGAFAPLTGYLSRRDYESVLSDMRLADGSLWPMPICLDVAESVVKEVQGGAPLVLRDAEGVALAVLDVEDAWQPSVVAEAKAVFGTDDPYHPGVAKLLAKKGRWYLGGRVRGIQLPNHYDFTDLRQTPAELRRSFAERGWDRVVAFQTRNPMHRAHFELTQRAAARADAHLLLHPVVGETRPGDIDPYTRVQCYRHIAGRYQDGAELSVLPLAMRMAGPREALWHALIRKNYGATHFIIGRDHAGPGNDESGTPFYGPYDAQELVREHEDEIGLRMVPFEWVVFAPDRPGYVTVGELEDGEETLSISGTELRDRLAAGDDIPEWFTFPEVTTELRKVYPPKSRQGFTVFFTGLSGSGKSTLANALRAHLLERGGRPVTLLDGDIVRKHLSSELGFSKEHRDLNIRRIGFVASEITKNGGAALCAPIAPYDSVRQEVRDAIEAEGGYVLVHVATCLEECERRDRKGLYAKARAGIIKEFTGISDPYEAPEDADLVIDTEGITVEECVERIVSYLEGEGYLAST